MRRRELLAGLGLSALAPGVAARQAERPALIGALSPDPTEFFPEYLARPFRATMQGAGWEEGRDYTLLTLSTGGTNEGLPLLARQIVERQPAVFLAFGDGAIRAAQAATKTIPIAAVADDMVGSGLVASMARPGSNTTGVSILASELDVKRLELLHELAPNAARLGALADPTTVSTRTQLERAAKQLGVDVIFASAQNTDQAVAAVRGLAVAGVGALNVCASPILYTSRAQIFKAVAALRIPTIYQLPEASKEGGLFAYGTRFSLVYRMLATHVIKLLDGAKPADLPVEQPTKFELVINLKTAQALGLTVPQALLARADELIE